MVNFDINVKNKDIVDDIEDAVEDGIRRAADEIGDASVNIAKQRIREAGAVWTGELLDSFNVTYSSNGNELTVTIENESDHAAPIEYGAEYTDRGPPVVALIPWVITHMDGFTVPDDSPSLDEREPVEGEMQSDEGDYVNVYDIADKETLAKAFWLQQHIKRHGLDAVGYMERAREWVGDAGNRTVSEYIHQEMQSV
jgi:hypothetical protein